VSLWGEGCDHYPFQASARIFCSLCPVDSSAASFSCGRFFRHPFCWSHLVRSLAPGPPPASSLSCGCYFSCFPFFPNINPLLFFSHNFFGIFQLVMSFWTFSLDLDLIGSSGVSFFNLPLVTSASLPCSISSPKNQFFSFFLGVFFEFLFDIILVDFPSFPPPRGFNWDGCSPFFEIFFLGFARRLLLKSPKRAAWKQTFPAFPLPFIILLSSFPPLFTAAVFPIVGKVKVFFQPFSPPCCLFPPLSSFLGVSHP